MNMIFFNQISYGIDLTSKGFMYADGKEGKTKKYLNAVLYDHIVTMTLPYLGEYKIGYNDGDNPEIVAKNAIIKLGISPCSDTGAELVVAIKKAIMDRIPSLSSSSSSSSASALQSSTPESLPAVFTNVSMNPIEEALFPADSQPDPEEGSGPLSMRK